MSFPWADMAIILGLIVLNGFFSGAELAIVSARRARLLALERKGARGARSTLALQEAQGRFLSAVQVGITLIGIANGAFSGARLSGPTRDLLVAIGTPPAVAPDLAFGLVVVVVTYLSLIIGELVPKQWALATPERLACAVAPLFVLLTKAAGPIVSFLDLSAALVLRVLRFSREGTSAITEDELRYTIAEAQLSGAIELEERELIAGIMRLADRHVRGVMTPRPEVDWIDVSASDEEVRAHLSTSPHTRVLVADGSVDNIIGVLQARDALATILSGRPLSLRRLVRKVPLVPDIADAMVALAELRAADVPMAIVVDEYGHFEGLVTPADLLSAIAGEFRSDMDAGHDPAFVRREDGSILVSGHMPADELAETLGFPLEEERGYSTVAGMALAELEHIPTTGETFETHGYRFEVVDMDGRRIDKLLLTALPEVSDDG